MLVDLPRVPCGGPPETPAMVMAEVAIGPYDGFFHTQAAWIGRTILAGFEAVSELARTAGELEVGLCTHSLY